MIEITPAIQINDNEISYDFIRASGPGGQNVNKVATAVQLRFNAKQCPQISKEIFSRLAKLAGKRMTEDGVLIIQASRFRSQEKNRRDALERLIELIRRASATPKLRRKTKPTRASRERTLSAKHHRSRLKRTRRKVVGDGD